MVSPVIRTDEPRKHRVVALVVFKFVVTTQSAKFSPVETFQLRRSDVTHSISGKRKRTNSRHRKNVSSIIFATIFEFLIALISWYLILTEYLCAGSFFDIRKVLLPRAQTYKDWFTVITFCKVMGGGGGGGRKICKRIRKDFIHL